MPEEKRKRRLLKKEGTIFALRPLGYIPRHDVLRALCLPTPKGAGMRSGFGFGPVSVCTMPYKQTNRDVSSGDGIQVGLALSMYVISI